MGKGRLGQAAGTELRDPTSYSDWLLSPVFSLILGFPVSKVGIIIMTSWHSVGAGQIVTVIADMTL